MKGFTDIRDLSVTVYIRTYRALKIRLSPRFLDQKSTEALRSMLLAIRTLEWCHTNPLQSVYSAGF